MNIVIRILSLISIGIQWVFLILILLTVFGMIVPYIWNLEAFPYLKMFASWERSINQMVKGYMPTRIAGYDLSRVITIIGLIFIMNIIQVIFNTVLFALQKRKIKSELKVLHETYTTAEQQKKIATLEAKVNKSETDLISGKTRLELLESFSNIKKELEKVGRDLSFLSIDVVDSTGMKKGEERSVVEADFMQYQKYVEGKFAKHGVMTAAWTPDGVMACFTTLDDAIKAAKEILNDLDDFNRNYKTIKRDFVLRCGINSGHVFYDESIPLERFSDHTLDTAGHLQKHAPPNTILISKYMIEPIKNHGNFIESDKVVDGLELFEWDKSKQSKQPKQ